MTPTIIETVNVVREPAWLPWAVSYFFLIGVAVASVLVSLPAALRRDGPDKQGRIMLLAATSCAMVAPVALLADLHQPGRFWHFYAHLTPWSWMSWGALLLPAFVGATLAYAWLGLKSAGPGWLLKPVAVLAGALALAVAVYTGMEVMVIKARPLWNTPLLPTMFLFTALAGAAGLGLVLNRFAGDSDPSVEASLNRLLFVFLGLGLANGAVWMLSGLLGWSQPAASALASLGGSAGWWALVAWALASSLVPMALAWTRPRGSGLVNGLIALHSTWMFRWSAFIGGQNVPKTGAGFYDWSLPLGGEGLAGIVGMFGLWLAVIIALTWLAPLAAHSPSKFHAAE